MFDPLTTRRCYKPAFSIEKSLEIIREGNGKHFDPAVVDAFNAGLDEVVEICDKHRDPEPVSQATSVERAGTQG